jgi:hypothetical protein
MSARPPVVTRDPPRSNAGMELLELHVRPDEHSGTWLVEPDRSGEALSSHRTATEAELAARKIAAARGAPRIFLHDRYRRVRALTPRR